MGVTHLALDLGARHEGGVLDIGVDNDIVKKSGAWYTYEGEQLGQGRENAKQFLVENPEIMIEISERIRTAMGIGLPDVVNHDEAVEGGVRVTEATEAAATAKDPDDEPISLDD